MIGHQRDILATLGIDLWIPRAQLCQPHQHNIWRDQATAEIVSDIIVQPQKIQAADAVIQPSIQTKVVPAQVSEQVIETSLSEGVAETLLQRESVAIQSFSLQALKLPSCSILIDATEMTQQTQQLWSNIQRAIAGEFLELNWPFPWGNAQDGRGAESYIQGFIDAISHEKSIVFLGEIPHIKNSKILQLASLEQMLEQPILKKSLWQLMQHKAATLE